MIRITKRLFHLALLALVILPFQNCGLQSGVIQTASSASKQESGNGGGYEGKPDGNYYRYVPNYSCNGSPVAQQITEIKNGQAYLYDNQKNQCANDSSGSLISNVDASPFQQDFISVADNLFKRYEEKPQGIPENLAEILCRDNFLNPSFEIVSHYDREKNEAVSRVYFYHKVVSDFAVSRILSVNKVQYVSNDLSFTVDLSKAIQAPKKYAGVVQKSSIVGLSSGPLVCIVGGSLDTSGWALKMLSDVEANSFRVTENNDVLVASDVSRTYYGSFYSSVVHIFKITFDGLVSDFSQAVLGANYDIKAQVTSNSKKINLFSAQKSSEGWPSTYVQDVRNGRVKRLTNLVAGGPTEAYFYNNPTLTKNEFLFYDTQIIDHLLNSTTVIRVYDLTTETITDIGRIDNLGTGNYGVISETNQLVQFSKDSSSLASSVQIYDAKTKNYKKLNLAIAANCKITGSQFEPVANNLAILSEQSCSGSDGSTVYNSIRISLIDGTVKNLGLASNRVSWISPNKNLVVLKNSLGVSSIYNVQTETVLPIPIDPTLGSSDDVGQTNESLTNFALSDTAAKIALINEKYLYGLGGSSNAPSMYQVDALTGASVSVCESAIGKKLFIGSLDDNKVFLFTYDQSLKVFRFYQVKSQTGCARINEFPSEFPYVPKLISTSIGFGLLLGNQLSATSSWTKEAVFVPIDGRPPLKFNSDTDHNWQMEVAADKNRIYLMGPDAKGLSKIFGFDLK